MNEFLDIYRLYVKNYHLDTAEDIWPEQDIHRLRMLLDKISKKIDNGHIIINTLKRELDVYPDPPNLHLSLIHIRATLFEIENTIDLKERELDQLIEDEIKEEPDQLIEKNVEEKKEEKKQEKKEPEVERKKTGEWKEILEDEEPLEKIGTINIYPSIKDHIWNNLPVDFKHGDVVKLFKQFYEERLNRKLKDSSYGTYASGYICHFKKHDPPMMSWDERDYSKNVVKYKEGTKEKPWETWEILIIKKQATKASPRYIQKHSLSHRTVQEIAEQAKKLGLKKNYYRSKGRDKKSKKMGKIKRWTDAEKDIIRAKHPTVDVADYMHLLPDRTRYAIEKEARFLKVYKITDSTHARHDMLESKEDKPENTEEVIENELNKPILTEETRKILEAEKNPDDADESDKKSPEEKPSSFPISPITDPRITEEKPVINNPFYKGSAEHHLYQTAMKCGWHNFKKGTPLVMIMRIMADFPKDEIKEAIGTLVKKKKAHRSPNNFIEFYR